MTVGLKKFSEYNTLAGASLRGDETILLADTASAATVTATTISAIATTNTINDSAGGLPIGKPGALVMVSGFTDTAAELNSLHTVVTSDANNLVIETDITVDEAAGSSVTVSEVTAMYQVTVDDIVALAASGGNISDITANRVRGVPTDVTVNISGGALAFDYTNGDYQYATLSVAGTDLTVSNIPAGGRMLIILIDADTYNPDVSAMTPLLNGEAITFGKITVIIAEALTNTTIRYVFAGTYTA